MLKYSLIHISLLCSHISVRLWKLGVSVAVVNIASCLADWEMMNNKAVWGTFGFRSSLSLYGPLNSVRFISVLPSSMKPVMIMALVGLGQQVDPVLSLPCASITVDLNPVWSHVGRIGLVVGAYLVALPYAFCLVLGTETITFNKCYFLKFLKALSNTLL